eukprot:11708014-Alexandrium_andersonii.AAC.1
MPSPPSVPQPPKPRRSGWNLTVPRCIRSSANLSVLRGFLTDSLCGSGGPERPAAAPRRGA